MQNPFRYFNSLPAIIRLAVMMYVRFPLSLRQVEDLLSERGIDICHETVRFWWNRFWSAVCSGDPEASDSSSLALELALAPGRSVRADQWGDALSVACR